MSFRKRVVLVNLLAVLFCLGKNAAAEIDSLTARYTAAGAADTTFNGTGYTVMNLSGEDRARDVFIDSNGRIVTCGHFTVANGLQLLIARYNADGTADWTFGTGGIVTMTYSGQTEAVGCAPDGSGRIVVAARILSGSSWGGLVIRFNSDGSLDGPFGPSDVGYIETALIPYDIKVAPDGKIVVAGKVGTLTSSDFAVARFTSEGNADPTFGSGGTVTTQVAAQDEARGVAIESNGRIVITGHSGVGATLQMHVIRYTAAGVVDWMTSIPFQSYTGGTGNSVAIETGGRIVVGGVAWTNLWAPRAHTLARLKTNGTLDTTFSNDGKVTWDTSDVGERNGMALGTDGKIVLAGRALAEFGKYILVMARFQTNGSLDASFGSNGIIAQYFPPRNAHVSAVAIDGSNRPVAVGQLID